MIARKSGAIVNVASLAGKAPLPFASTYSASKGGLVSFSESLGSEIEGSGVTVSVVCPGFVADAGMWATHEASGVKAPRMTKPVSPQKVADGVIRAIKGAPEVIVASGPMRPLLAFAEMAPGQKRTLTRRMGIRRVFEEEANRLQQGHDRVERRAEEAPSELRV
jgi:short-subunit dehydrogenase